MIRDHEPGDAEQRRVERPEHLELVGEDAADPGDVRRQAAGASLRVVPQRLHDGHDRRGAVRQRLADRVGVDRGVDQQRLAVLRRHRTGGARAQVVADRLAAAVRLAVARRPAATTGIDRGERRDACRSARGQPRVPDEQDDERERLGLRRTSSAASLTSVDSPTPAGTTRCRSSAPPAACRPAARRRRRPPTTRPARGSPRSAGASATRTTRLPGRRRLRRSVRRVGHGRPRLGTASARTGWPWVSLGWGDRSPRDPPLRIGACACGGSAPDLVPYEVGLGRAAPGPRRGGRRRRGAATRVLLLEHQPVYTAGRRTEPWERPADGTPVIDVDRGGKITWHGPGQLVGYPILRLPEPLDVVALRPPLEELLIDVCAELGLADRPGRGPQRRLGAGRRPAARTARSRAIGVRVARGRHDARLRAQLRLRPGRVRPDRRRAASPDAGGHVADRRARPAGHRRRRRCPLVERRGSGSLPQPARSVASVTRRARRAAGCCASRRATPPSPIERKPPWIKTRRGPARSTPSSRRWCRREGLHTVCQEAGCPNIYECWEDREATFLIGGDQCTRRCDFCQIDTGKPAAARPRRAAPGRRVGADDGPALRHGHRRRPRRPRRRGRLAVRRDRPRRSTPLNPGTGVELLDPRLQRRRPSCSRRSSTPRPRCSRTTSRRCRGSSSGSGPASATSARWTSSPPAARRRPGHQVQPDPRHGRDPDEIVEALHDLHDAGCDLVTITQYLRPSARHHPVDRWVHAGGVRRARRRRRRRSASPA